MLKKIKRIKYFMLALFKPTEEELEELGRSVDSLNHAIAITKGDKEYRLGQLAYALRHAVEAQWGTGAKLPYKTRVKLLRFLDTQEWNNAKELGDNIAESHSFDKRIDSTNQTLFEVLKEPLIALGDIFLYSPEFKDSNLAKILPLVRGQNALA